MITNEYIDSLGIDQDKAGCFRELAGLSGDSLTAFENAVDG